MIESRARKWGLGTVPALLMLAAVVAAGCSSPELAEEDPEDIEEHMDEPRATELQSDFLDLNAGVEWLSFVRNDWREYPAVFEDYENEERYRRRMAPADGADKVLMRFKLPKAAKIWPVEWYGIDVAAVDLPKAKGFTIALARPDDRSPEDVAKALASARAELSGGEAVVEDGLAYVRRDDTNRAIYGARRLTGGTVDFLLVVEAKLSGDGALLAAHAEDFRTVLDAGAIDRELSLEGMPNHKCESSKQDLLDGVIRYPGGILQVFPEPDQNIRLRKVGDNSTVQIDGYGAEPWMLFRRIEPDIDNSLRQNVRMSTVFRRRVSRTTAQFSEGRRVDGAHMPIVVFDYSDHGQDHVLLGVLAVGDELLSVEVISNGLRNKADRIQARKDAISLLRHAKELGGSAPSDALDNLDGWNP